SAAVTGCAERALLDELGQIDTARDAAAGGLAIDLSEDLLRQPSAGDFRAHGGSRRPRAARLDGALGRIRPGRPVFSYLRGTRRPGVDGPCSAVYGAVYG